MEQVVDGLQRPADAELLAQESADVLAPESTHPVGRGRAGPQAVLEALLPAVVEGGLPPAARPVRERGEAAGVVPGDPGADPPLGKENLLADFGRGVPEPGEPDGGQPAGHPGARLGPDRSSELVGGVVRFDVHGGLLPGNHHPTHRCSAGT